MPQVFDSAQSAHLALLCKCRDFEIEKTLLHLPADSPSVPKLKAESRVNAECLALLEPSSAVRAA